MNKQNELNWIRIPCGMHIGTMQAPRLSRIRGIINRFKKTIKRTDVGFRGIAEEKGIRVFRTE